MYLNYISMNLLTKYKEKKIKRKLKIVVMFTQFLFFTIEI